MKKIIKKSAAVFSALAIAAAVVVLDVPGKITARRRYQKRQRAAVTAIIRV